MKRPQFYRIIKVFHRFIYDNIVVNCLKYYLFCIELYIK
jgi:hypothetical protein